MKKALPLLVVICIFCSCGNISSKAKHENATSKYRDSTAMQAAIDSQMKAGDRPDSEQDSPPGEEVLKETLDSYSKVVLIDSLIKDQKDTLHIHIKYYCLHDSSLVVPKKLIWWKKPAEDFRTNNFAAKIWVVKNRDTIFNRLVSRKNFEGVVTDDYQKKYAILFEPSFKFDAIKKKIIINFSFSIPTTDLGKGVSLIIDENGSYKVFDDYMMLHSNI